MNLEIPHIDPTVRHVPVSYLRRLNTEVLRQTSDTLVVNGFDGEEPLAVILPYKVFLLIQRQLLDTAI